MRIVTVRDTLRLALPPETSVVAGSAGMAHQVTWVATLRATLPAFVDLRGSEIALLAVEAAKALDPRLTLANLIRRLGQASVAAVAVVGEIEEEDCKVAEAANLPLLQLPEGSDLREIEREISRLIADYEAQLERRAAQLYNLLTQHSLDGSGMLGLLSILAERTGQSVACYAANGELRAQQGHGSGLVLLQALQPNTPGDNSLLKQQVWVEPIGATTYPSGYLALAGTKLDEWDKLTVKQGAAALALELAKERAVYEAEERLRGDFLSNVLAGPISDPPMLIQRGQELGYDLTLPYVALLITLEAESPTLLGRMATSIQTELNRRQLAAPSLRRENSVLCLLPLKPKGLQPREFAEALRERLRPDYQRVILALGTPTATLVEWTRTVKEAEQALMLGRQLFGSEKVLAFNDLGIYRLLVLLREAPEMWSFYRENLATLVAYDQKQGGELLKTLEAYFNHLANLRATSEALHIHRNTLLYRLERIKEISGMDLNNAEQYFALWLALRAHRVLRTLES